MTSRLAGWGELLRRECERAVRWTEGVPCLRMAMPGPEGHRLLLVGRRLLGKTLL